MPGLVSGIHRKSKKSRAQARPFLLLRTHSSARSGALRSSHERLFVPALSSKSLLKFVIERRIEFIEGFHQGSNVQIKFQSQLICCEAVISIEIYFSAIAIRSSARTSPMRKKSGHLKDLIIVGERFFLCSMKPKISLGAQFAL
jgi:hypothetical protein